MARPTHFLHVRLSRAGVLQLVIAFSAGVAALSLGAHAVSAQDAAATAATAAAPNSSWCVETPEAGASPDCTYDNYLVCAVAAIRAGGLCKAGETVVAS